MEDSDYNYFAWPAATAAPVATFFDKVGREREEKNKQGKESESITNVKENCG